MPKSTGRQPFQLPADLSNLTEDQLAKLAVDAGDEFDGLMGGDDASASEDRMSELLDAMEAITARQGEIATQKAEAAERLQTLATRRAALNGQPDGEGEGDADSGEGDAETVTEPAAAPAGGELVGAGVGAPAAAPAIPVGGAVTASRDTGGLGGPRHNLNVRLGQAPKPPTPIAPETLAITASVGLPGALEPGARVRDWRQLSELIAKRAKQMPNQKGAFAHRRPNDPYGGVQIASIENKYDFTVDETTRRDAVDEYVDNLRAMQSATRFSAEVAAGGWCAPPEIRYSFFNIAAECGAIDLPTFGVNRGGLEWPVSPSLADTFSPALPWFEGIGGSTVPWLWNNTMDTAAVTGSPTKPCIRVPCSTMTEQLLECYGICLTAGNLTDNAWPEATRNFLRLLMAAFYHAKNGRYIQTMVAQSTAMATGGCFDNNGAAATFLNGSELAARDIRTKFGMCDTDVIEGIYPAYALDIARADLARRTGVSDFMAVPDSQIANWFSARGIAAQFVQDWQVRAAGQPGVAAGITAWPGTLQAMLYPAGTFGLGNGMSLDLGVVRDSTLNETNDFTAAWLEECHLIAKFGHESRLYTFTTCASGQTGAASLTDCC